LCADRIERRRRGGADLRDFRPTKPSLLNEPNRPVGSVQLKLRAPAPRLDRVDMGWRMIIGIDRHADVSDRQDGRHATGCQKPSYMSRLFCPERGAQRRTIRYLPRLLASAEYKAALAEYQARAGKR
jgi:hypothetical protein